MLVSSPLKGEKRSPSVLIVEALEVGTRAAGCVDAYYRWTNFTVRRDGGNDSFGHENLKRSRIKAATADLLEADRSIA